ncbi:uncharacterized protein LOC103316181 [Nasonia vitripennis]|uniref:Uncharacterized protein n=1 Tax=Nasonia vitripennis TaxID=7425 RepID=A0A7M7QM10_NASVI|nr:uncharacterized protein LOC103316181 [Nasonia vitripennis]XP_031788990.1 uncharacterized protein LOC103316181 [Nasonia vitripennis]
MLSKISVRLHSSWTSTKRSSFKHERDQFQRSSRPRAIFFQEHLQSQRCNSTSQGIMQRCILLANLDYTRTVISNNSQNYENRPSRNSTSNLKSSRRGRPSSKNYTTMNSESEEEETNKTPQRPTRRSARTPSHEII